jgi:hypothetical protein
MGNQEQTVNGCAVAGLMTLFIGIFVMGGIMGIASIVLGALAMKGIAWAKVLGILEIVIGTIFALAMFIVIGARA